MTTSAIDFERLEPRQLYSVAAPAVLPPAFPGIVLARRVFYNNSHFDLNSPEPSLLDPQAVAPDKQPLLPGQTATFANYTGYSLGINGIELDVAGLPPAGAISAADFTFRAGRDGDPASWAAVPDPGVFVRRGAGGSAGNGSIPSDLIHFIWPDNQIQDTWLQVTVLANADTNLVSPDVFYFGNAVGETGNRAGDTRVTSGDVRLTRKNRTRPGQAGPDITSPFDIDRSGGLDVADRKLVAGHKTTRRTALPLLAAPAIGSASLARSDAGAAGTFRPTPARKLAPARPDDSATALVRAS